MKPRDRRPHVVVTGISRHTAAVRGLNVQRAVNAAGCPAIYDRRPADDGEPCWTVPLHHAEQVMAAAVRLGGSAKVGQETLW